ncbi:MAG: methyltransferase domain-containing protein [Phaeodactylibacter sp.]|nr:methyltransferase domain-containing protein [Phaeodactylibacter sp.]MCB9265547.1 methyltransferase domain-containing protein [Lewinellaceae bacterium]MCB9288492.1 methyltransferase domain-containing protein [Lewinellaceae bacterium]
MNYKLLFPTYRNRYLFIQKSLERLSAGHQLVRALNLGAGEGDYDSMIAGYCGHLVSCDINEQDINYARELNAGVPNLEYRVEDALNLSFEDNTFDLVISVEVIEHVGQPERMIEEVQRVLKPGGMAVITFPSLDFPFTYDPVNRLLSYFSAKKISQGAYAFGHEYLVSGTDFRAWSEKNHLAIVQERNLSGYLIGLLEMYWTGIIQRVFKANATNLSTQKEKKIVLRPSSKGPFLTKLTDLVIKIDEGLFSGAANSVGKGFIIQKKG